LRYVWTLTLVALGLLIGFIFEPVFGASLAYATFYPGVLLVAYAFGPKPAMVATGLSAVLAYWCLVPPDFQWKWDIQVGSALAFFLVASLLGISLITRLVRVRNASLQLKPADLARVNAMIFADLAARNATITAPAFVSATRTRAVRRPSERSFDIARLDRDAVHADQPATAERTGPRQQDVLATGGRGATLH
jgi:K+-sensing histidine kinase KdpD